MHSIYSKPIQSFSFSLTSLHMALCTHLFVKSDRLFRHEKRRAFLSLAMNSFSVRHKSQYLAPFRYCFVFARIVHLIFGSIPSSSFHTKLARVVYDLCFGSLKDCLWFLYLSLKLMVEPTYVLSSPFLSLTVALYTTASLYVAHLPSRGHLFLYFLMQLHDLSVCLTCVTEHVCFTCVSDFLLYSFSTFLL